MTTLSPVIIIDTREQTPLTFTRLRAMPGTLQSGDYAPQGLEHSFTVERKSLPDLIASLTHERERFERELHRLRGFHFARVIVTAPRRQLEAGDYRSRATPAAMLASVTAFEVRYGVPFVFVEDEAAAALLIESWFTYAARDALRTAAALRPETGGQP